VHRLGGTRTYRKAQWKGSMVVHSESSRDTGEEHDLVEGDVPDMAFIIRCRAFPCCMAQTLEEDEIWTRNFLNVKILYMEQ
jgi:hypothetical protein